MRPAGLKVELHDKLAALDKLGRTCSRMLSFQLMSL